MGLTAGGMCAGGACGYEHHAGGRPELEELLPPPPRAVAAFPPSIIVFTTGSGAPSDGATSPAPVASSIPPSSLDRGGQPQELLQLRPPAWC
uniref:Putative retrotransposon protein n=1 Tax=Oryza sativa subsp. indica TaxID=39946 RepID=A0A8F2VW12_ORYSI|nr:putative retrotransposon protein [Oryza sativa Indica Group]